MEARAYQKWKWMAPLGLTLIGLGLSLTGEAIILKAQAAPGASWIWMGTLGLCVVNAGISVFGDAVKRRFWMEVQTKAAAPGDGPR
ncbi:MAG: hypothetical protein SF053_16450 [Bacteroidia bacterium]|nr:hypothetical protein [Bacteroidia bacterium]